MKDKWLSEIIVYKHRLCKVKELPKDFNLSENSVYEVIRVVNSTPLFVEAHYSRLISSLRELQFSKHLSISQLYEDIMLFIKSTMLVEGNIRIEVIINKCFSNYLVYRIPHAYPNKKLYTRGVVLKTFEIERPHPHVKQSSVNNHIRTAVKDLLNTKGIFEVLLINHFMEITEGSKSNVLFISGNTIVSPPTKDILKGITREVIMSLATGLGYKTTSRKILLSEIAHFDACFITGTTPKVLPVCQIDSVYFNVQNELINKLMKAYDASIEQYCKTPPRLKTKT